MFDGTVRRGFKENSPIRLNDTYRSNIVFGEDNHDGYRSARSFSSRRKTVTNVVVDSKEIHRQQYAYHTRSIMTSFSPHRQHNHRALSCTPARRELTQAENISIMKQNRSKFEACKDRCGMTGHGVKGAMDHENRCDTSTISEEQRAMKFSMRNLDGEASEVIKNENSYRSTR